MIQNFGSSVPFWDQWGAEAANLYLPWLNGNLTLNHLFHPHNEHRIFFSRILSLLLLILNERQWDPLLGMVVNAFISTCTAIFLIIILNNLLGKVVQNTIIFVICLLWSLPYGWENIIASFQSAFYIMLLFTLILLWGLLLHDNFSFKWWLGAIFALLAIFTVASGFLILLVIIVLKLYLMIIDNRPTHLPTLLISIVITSISIVLIVRIVNNEVLMANNITEFMLAFGKALAWPWIEYPFVSLILYLPFLTFVFRILWLRHKPSQAELFVLALGGWVILQAASIAYARGAGGIMQASRYMDMLALGVIVNVLAFYFIAKHWHGLSHQIKLFLNIGICFWALFVMLGMIGLTIMGSWPHIQQRGLQ
ncbi:MAG: hypothetical protein IMF12_06980, partial [Proteobacteria bacterium]|nr:hypothetical protein [Pseudomonadota bacterium]